MKRDIKTYSDKQLVALMQESRKSSDAAFTEIYDRYGLRINAYIRTIVNDYEQAEDIFQETFLKFYQYARSDFKGGSIIGFLITIARNLCLNAKRDKKHTVPIEEFNFVFQDAVKYEDKEMAELVIMAMDLIGENHKEAMTLRYFNGLRYAEIAEILEITNARARYLVFSGKQKIKDVLHPYLKELTSN